MFEFTLEQKGERFARLGTLHVRDIKVETPVFMPVGTYAAVKAVSPQDLKDVGVQIILSNAYHKETRRHSQLYRLGWRLSYRFRWLSNLQPVTSPKDRTGWSNLSISY
jgi:queuine tRNA-ribosyltransferase